MLTAIGRLVQGCIKQPFSAIVSLCYVTPHLSPSPHAIDLLLLPLMLQLQRDSWMVRSSASQTLVCATPMLLGCRPAMNEVGKAVIAIEARGTMDRLRMRLVRLRLHRVSNPGVNCVHLCVSPSVARTGRKMRGLATRAAVALGSTAKRLLGLGPSMKLLQVVAKGISAAFHLMLAAPGLFL